GGQGGDGPRGGDERRAARRVHRGHEAPALPRGGRPLPAAPDPRRARCPRSSRRPGLSARPAALVKVGVLGGGQLGWMLARAGDPLGIRCRFLDPSSESPAGRVGELIVGAYEDPAALDRLVDGLALITYEFENVPVASARRLAERVRVWPPPQALEVSQDRVIEKQFLESAGVP